MSTQTSSSTINNPHPTLHFTSRSKEFLSCAKTAARVVDPSISPSTLQLHPPIETIASTTQAFSSISDALSLLSHSDSILSQLEILVKRRGHTNDPSDDIQLSLSKFEAISSNLATLVTTIALDGRGGSEQRRRHFELVGQRVRDMGKERVDKLKSLMEIRGEVIKSQTRRRKLLDAADKRTASTSGRSSSLSTSVNNYSQLSSPLFTMTGRSNKMSSSSSSAPNSSTTKPAISTAPPSNGAVPHRPPPTATPAYGGYSHQHSAPTYGGYYNNNNYTPLSNGTGMRRRNNANNTTTTTTTNPHHLPPPDDPTSHQQQQTYMRSTRTRLDEAQNAERTLSELTKVFSKMADLISTQSEVLEKIEDDVEAAHGHVEKGQQEIVKLYEVTRGNRGLILKVFGVLIGLIVFMRLY